MEEEYFVSRSVDVRQQFLDVCAYLNATSMSMKMSQQRYHFYSRVFHFPADLR
jgi:hypothetical protein